MLPVLSSWVAHHATYFCIQHHVLRFIHLDACNFCFSTYFCRLVHWGNMPQFACLFFYLWAFALFPFFGFHYSAAWPFLSVYIYVEEFLCSTYLELELLGWRVAHLYRIRSNYFPKWLYKVVLSKQCSYSYKQTQCLVLSKVFILTIWCCKMLYVILTSWSSSVHKYVFTELWFSQVCSSMNCLFWSHLHFFVALFIIVLSNCRHAIWMNTDSLSIICIRNISYQFASHL